MPSTGRTATARALEATFEAVQSQVRTLLDSDLQSLRTALHEAKKDFDLVARLQKKLRFTDSSYNPLWAQQNRRLRNLLLVALVDAHRADGRFDKIEDLLVSSSEVYEIVSFHAFRRIKFAERPEDEPAASHPLYMVLTLPQLERPMTPSECRMVARTLRAVSNVPRLDIQDDDGWEYFLQLVESPIVQEGDPDPLNLFAGVQRLVIGYVALGKCARSFAHPPEPRYRINAERAMNALRDHVRPVDLCTQVMIEDRDFITKDHEDIYYVSALQVLNYMRADWPLRSVTFHAVGGYIPNMYDVSQQTFYLVQDINLWWENGLNSIDIRRRSIGQPQFTTCIYNVPENGHYGDEVDKNDTWNGKTLCDGERLVFNEPPFAREFRNAHEVVKTSSVESRCWCGVGLGPAYTEEPENPDESTVWVAREGVVWKNGRVIKPESAKADDLMDDVWNSS